MDLVANGTCTDCISGDAVCSCFTVGLCQGFFIGSEITSDIGQCLQECKAMDKCKWISFKGEDGECVLLEDCSNLDASKTEFLSGQKDCDSGSIEGMFHCANVHMGPPSNGF